MNTEVPCGRSGISGFPSVTEARRAVPAMSQSRVAKMEAGDPSVSIDLPVRALFKLGGSRQDLVRHLAAPTKRPAA